MKKNLLAILFAVVMIASCVLIIAPAAKAETAEVAIPEGSIMINDFSTSYDAVQSNWGGGESYKAWEAEVNGRSGVLALGGNASYSGFYIHMGDAGCFDQFETITIRLYVRAGTRAVYLSHNGWPVDQSAQFSVEEEKWVDYTIKVADYAPMGNALEFRIATPEWGNQPLVFIDQIYGTPKAEPVKELEIPEGAVMINDFSSEYTAGMSNWGGGESFQAWGAETEGRAGVLTLGGNNSYSGYYIHVGDAGCFDQFETITIRMYVRSGIRGLYLSHNALPVDQCAQFDVDKDQWIEYTINTADYAPIGNGLELRLATPEWGAQGFVHIDQIYGTPRGEQGGNEGGDSAPTGDVIAIVLATMAVSGLGIVVLKKKEF